MEAGAKTTKKREKIHSRVCIERVHREGFDQGVLKDRYFIGI